MESTNLKSCISRINWSNLEDFINSHVVHCADLSRFGSKDIKVDLPGLVILVGKSGQVIYRKAFGCKRIMPQASAMLEETVFDVGDISKALVTTTLAMKLVEKGMLEVDRRLSRVFQTFGILGKERMTIRHLLSHMSGYPVQIPFYRRISKADRQKPFGMIASNGAVDEVYSEIFRAKLEHIPGKHMAENNVGFILLGHALEIIGGMPLDRQALNVVLKPLRMKSTGFIKMSSLRKDRLEPVAEIIAPMGHCSWRERDICGEVWDENAWTMGGVAGHAGVFTTADDLFRFASELIECWHGRGMLVSRDVVKTFWLRQDEDPKKTWALGWNTNAGESASCGSHFSRFSVGHDSSTGCSLWIDPHRELSVVILSNPQHLRSNSNGIKKIRPEIHNLVMQALSLG